jgi:2,3-bisphosphoglycerate-independent phosphoglycerate mutase
LVKTISDDMKPGSDVANLSILGYEPSKYYTGRSPLEAGALGIKMEDGDVALRCNLVTLSDEANYGDKTMLDYCAGDISTQDAAVLIKFLAESLNTREFTLYNGVGYRHCLIWRGGTLEIGALTPPHDIMGGKIARYLAFSENAKKPNMDTLARSSLIGLVKTVSDDMKPGSDVANLSVLGYEPSKYYTGRSPLEAGALGVKMEDGDVALRCNLVTLSGEANFGDKTMLDYCAGDISTRDAAVLIKFLAERFNTREFTLHNGVGYRHCLIWHGGTLEIGALAPPHDIMGEKTARYLAFSDNAKKLLFMMEDGCKLLSNHPLNAERVKNGLEPANGIWLWGEGKRAELPAFEVKYGLKAAVISAVDLLKGIGGFSGMKVVDLRGATGYIDSDFKGKAEACLNELRNGCDLVYVHMEAPDECGHRGEVRNKVKSVEIIDEIVLGTLLPALDEFDDFKIMLLPDHATPLSLHTHTRDPVPFMVFQKTMTHSGQETFSEKTAAETGLYIDPGHELMKFFLGA